MTDKPARRRTDDPEVLEKFIKKIARTTAEETVEKTVQQTITRFCTTLGMDASTPEAIINVQKTWAFADRARKVCYAIFVTGLIGGLSLVGKKVVEAPSALKALAGTLNPWA